MAYRLAFTVLAASVLAGLLASPAFKAPGLQDLDLGETGDRGDGGEFVYGSTHEHALFYIVVNGSALDLTADRFQLNSRYVHLENNRSRIVHKHAEEVTWSYFLETVNVSIRNVSAGRYCVTVAGSRYCGRGEVTLNGAVFRPGKEIQQGDNLVIALGRNASRTAENYLEEELPGPYRRQEGRSL